MIHKALPLLARDAGRLIGLWAFLPVVRLALTGLLLLPPTSAPAQSSPRPVALILCNWKYRHLAPLLTPEADAAAMKRTLEGLSPAYEVTVVANATSAETREAIAAFTKRHAGNPVVLVYTSGHGLQVNGTNYLAGVDVDMNAFETQGKALRQAFPDDEEYRAQVEALQRSYARKHLVSMDDLIAQLGTMSPAEVGDSHVKMVFIDACREAFPDLEDESLAVAKSLFGSKGGGGLARVTERPGIFVGMSAAAGQVSQQNDPDRLAVRAVLLPQIQALGAAPFLWRFFEQGGSATDVVEGTLPPSLFTERLAAEIAAGGSLEEVFNRTGAAVRRVTETLQQEGRLKTVQTPAKYSLYYGAYRFGAESSPPMAGPTPQGVPKGRRPGDLLKVPLGGDVTLHFRWCPPTGAGGFAMGSPVAELGRDDEKATTETRHAVVLTEGFWMGETEVTQRQWRAVTGRNLAQQTKSGLESEVRVRDESSGEDRVARGLLGHWLEPAQVTKGVEDDDYPIYWVTWHEAKEFADLAGQKLPASLAPHLQFDLPTEAQWEYACRAGTIQATPMGDLTYGGKSIGQFDLNKHAWTYNNSTDGYTGEGWRQDYLRYGPDALGALYGPRKVGELMPNAWQLRDMLGNVKEWCLDWHAAAYGAAEVTDPTGPASGTEKVVRGGGFSSGGSSCRSASRHSYPASFAFPSIGFRLVLLPR